MEFLDSTKRRCRDSLLCFAVVSHFYPLSYLPLNRGVASFSCAQLRFACFDTRTLSMSVGFLLLLFSVSVGREDVGRVDYLFRMLCANHPSYLCVSH